MAATRIPRIAIVGRPNVGKSTLTNRLCHSRVSIVEPTEGVTRDRVSVRTRLATPWGERAVEIIDTGGIGIVDRDDLGPVVEEQVRTAIETADLILFLVDSRSGPTPLDHEVARRLRGIDKPVLLVCNKVETAGLEWEVDAFRELGVGDTPWPISAQNGDGVTELVEHMASQLPALEREEGVRIGAGADTPVLKIAVVGRRNAGKSTLVNAFAREERVIVSEVPGTTRDAVDVVVERDGLTTVLIDTAGVRKKKSLADAVEFYSDRRSHKAIRRADVVVLLFDTMEPISGIERRLARYVRDHYRCVVLAANKWDLTDDADITEMRQYVDRELIGLNYAPFHRLSAKDGWNVKRLFDLCREVHARASVRVPTGELNRVLARALEARSPSSKGHRVRVKYATQTDVAPPTFVLFVNDRRLIGKDYLRYIENRLRAELPLDDVPIRLVLRDKEPTDEEITE